MLGCERSPAAGPGASSHRQTNQCGRTRSVLKKKEEENEKAQWERVEY